MDSMNHVQTQMQQARNAYDVQSLDALRQGAQKNDKQALEETAKHFEAIFVQMMLKSMRAAEDVLADENSPFNSQEVKFYRDMHDQQLATNMSASGSVGLAEVIVQQLDPQRSNVMPANLLRNDGNLSTINDFSRAKVSMAQNRGLAESSAELLQGPQKKPGFESPEEFVRNLLPIAQQAAEKIGLDPKAMVAQAAVETGWGQYLIHSGDGQNSHNLFGVKASRGWQGEKNYIDTLEFEGGTAQKTKAPFRAYGSFEESMNDYVNFLQASPRYQQALQRTDDPATYFNELQKSGYATDPAYADKVMSVYNSERLSAESNKLNTMRSAL
ncbi:flagellar assembly peptidoglycan hydrolase FlgJ [Planctobacterium marinum]|uniref:Peptidoglycan hydrolase FlgJ n=1 Tax=Planctobacterium marinum TaxID=1631968 RepID=A0AA48HJ27_9ALTE|nr:peptidoglycan hydrolase FlgJ [Planctobacterium marinum]